MQHGVFRSVHYLDLRLNFQHDLSRSDYSSFDASQQEGCDACTFVVLLLNQKVLLKKIKNYNKMKKYNFGYVTPFVQIDITIQVLG